MKKTAILDISQFKQTGLEDFYVNTLEDHLITSHKDIALPHKHNFYLAILFTHGIGIHEIDFTVYDVKPGSLFFLNPGQTHHWELSPDTKGYIFFHTQAFYNLYYTQNHINNFPFFYSMHSSPCLYLEGEEFKDITLLFKRILKENERDEILKKHRIINLVQYVYIECTRIYARQNPVAALDTHNSYYSKFLKLEDLVNEHFAKEKSPAVYAEMMHMTPKHLNRITQAVAGKTTSDVITDRVLLEAKKELILQQDNFAGVAEMLGYEDYAYFSRLFKKKTNETPSEFLNRYKKG
ncbi:AraC family transcriptional regulator [Flavobacterium alkalisoli]|uniref:AraC family transcriptional regulator n=1 Tax=Flavobacterium alkalisoli TaxID=2602769 RepID=UPI003A9386FB